MIVITTLLVVGLVALAFFAAIQFHLIHWLLASRRSDKNLIKAYEASRAELLAQNYSLALEVQASRASAKPFSVPATKQQVH